MACFFPPSIIMSTYQQPKFPENRTQHFSKNLDKRPWESSMCKGFRTKSQDDRLNSPKSGVWIFLVFLVEIFAEQQNFERLKNREDGSDFADSWKKSIATTRSSFSNIFALSKKFSSNRSGPRSVRDRSETEDRTGPDRISVPIRRTGRR